MQGKFSPLQPCYCHCAVAERCLQPPGAAGTGNLRGMFVRPASQIASQHETDDHTRIDL